jgi:DNA recombination protein RmuC
MFIPNEGSYILAMNYDPALGHKAFKQGVILLNPTNLMMALFLVLQTWRNTQQEDNCRKIIEVANGLYEKFVGLYSTCETLGNQLTTVNTTYKKVLTQLHDGSGNIVGRVERLIELGVPSTKRIQRKSNRLTSNEVEE